MSTKIANPYRVEWSKFSDGERMPFLVRTATGVPIEAVTFWIVGDRRPTGAQPNTLANSLRSLIYLYLWADLRGIDILERLRVGNFFTLPEVLDLVDVAGRFVDDILLELNAPPTNVIRLRRPKTRSVKAGEKRNRLIAIHGFLTFISADFMSALQGVPPRWSHYGAVRKECLDRIDSHRKALVVAKSASINGRKGLEKVAVSRMKDVIVPDHPENPFKQAVRFRNYVMIRMLIELGIRRGELLGILVEDYVVGSTATVSIHRRPDNPDETRSGAGAATKTEARILSLHGQLADLLHEWITYHRRAIEGARYNKYLFVNTQGGEPLSPDMVNKIFSTLRRKVSGLPKNMTPHVLRHTWNDLFSETMDRNGVTPEEELSWRANLMGWRSRNSAEHYLKRTVTERSNDALRKMQNELSIDGGTRK